MIRTQIGNPLIEVGYHAMAAFCNKAHPSELDLADYEHVADYITTKYTTPGAWRNFLAGAVFPNSGFAQFAYDKPHLQPRKFEYARSVLRLYQPDTPTLGGKHCALCGREAVFMATREHIPLLNARDYGNFSAMGEPGLPVCGICLLAAHALPLGCRIIGGRLFAVHSDDQEIMAKFAEWAVKDMLKTLQIESLEKIPGQKFPKTRLIEALVRAEIKRRGVAVTAYLFTNSGQSADIEIIEVPSEVVQFLALVTYQADSEIRQAWNWAVERGWQTSKRKKGEGEVNINEAKNELYEDLFGLPGTASWFLRKHLLPVRSWPLIRYFIEKVMQMDAKLIDLLQELGNRIGDYTLQENRGYFFNFMREKKYTQWRQKLIEANYDYVKKHGQPLIKAEEFLKVFTKPRDADKYWSWRLPRDIVALRILEKWAEANAQLPDATEIFSNTQDSDTEDET